MKISILLLIMSVISQITYANTASIKPKVTDATIYLDRALVNSTAQVSLDKGSNYITITGLSDYTDESSIQIALDKRAQLISMTPVINHLSEEQGKSPEIDKLKQRQKKLNQEILLSNYELQALNAQLNIIEKNAVMGNEQSRNIDQIKALARFVQEQSLSINTKKIDQTAKKENLEKELAKIEKQLQEETASSRLLRKELILEIEAREAHQCAINLSYILYNVSWKPCYDIRANANHQGIEIVYKAEITQRSGMPWEHVKLTLSSFRPRSNQNRPILAPQYVGTQKPELMVRGGLNHSEILVNAYQMTTARQKDEFIANEIMEAPAVEAMSQVGLIFELSGSKSLPSSNKAQTVSLKSQKTSAQYIHHVVPKLSTDVYLLANIEDWQNLNLLYGQAHIYYDNNYMGTTTIDPNFTKNEFPVSLGVDERIVVKRKEIKDYDSKQAFKKNSRLYHYETILKNNSTQDIKIEILDQLPQSSENTIEVNPVELSGATPDQYGTLLWTKELARGKESTLVLKYNIQYPKGQALYFR